MYKADVAVIGAGLAGLQCARSLAMRGLRVILIDRKESIADNIQTTGIFVRKTWEDFPLPDNALVLLKRMASRRLVGNVRCSFFAARSAP